MRLEALKAALTSWPSVEFVRMERRWRGLKAEVVVEGILGSESTTSMCE